MAREAAGCSGAAVGVAALAAGAGAAAFAADLSPASFSAPDFPAVAALDELVLVPAAFA